MDDNWEQFLNALESRTPSYGVVEWNGETRQVAFSVQFTRPDDREPAEIVRARARQFFSRLSPAERVLLEIEVHKRNGIPVFATVRQRTQAIGLGTGRLRDLTERFG